MSKLEKLKELVPLFAHNKRQADDYKKIAEKYNKEIKDIMSEADLNEFTESGITVKRIESVQESFDEQMLIEILKKYGAEHHIVKTKEYVDFDTLENFIYNDLIPKEAIFEMDKARKTKKVVSLRLSHKKEK